MCYKNITHTLHCDVRRLVAIGTDVSRPLVNPYDTPTTCSCSKQDPIIKYRLQCDYGHKCCFMTVTKVYCRKENCKELISFHKYTRRNIAPSLLGQLGPATADEGWAPLPVIDGDFCDLGLVPRASVEFTFVRQKFLRRAKGLYEVLLQIKKTEAKARQTRMHLLGPEHDICVYISYHWRQMRRYSREPQFQCKIKREAEKIDQELLRLESDLALVRWQIAQHYVRLCELEQAGDGIITGLTAWGELTVGANDRIQVC